MKKIAYLAPEIPSLSATFVYGEILALQQRNITITSLSIDRPHLPELDINLQQLLAKTTFLYERHWLAVLQDNFAVFRQNPFRYLAIIGLIFQDILHLGLFNSTALKLLYHFWQASAVASILQRNQCEHLHIHFSYVPTQVGMYGALLANIPFSFTSHANDLFERCWLMKQKINRCQFAVTISEYNRQFLKTKINQIKIDKVKVIHCGINLNDYTFQLKSSFSETIRIKSLGRFVEKKGFDTLILAAVTLRNQGLDFHLEIGGDGPEKAKLWQLITEYQLSSHITLVGSLSHQAVFPWLREADIFVLACKQDHNGDRDGIPVVLMEAMAVGIPVISTQISGIPELIEDGVSGFLAVPNDSQSLADKIMQCLSQSEQMPMITSQARAKIEASFNIEKTTEQLLELF
jgi:glycosyltransferase involved in cell wall biosynthesis